jgi:ABC-2 type transport system ATP-binding protein
MMDERAERRDESEGHRGSVAALALQRVSKRFGDFTAVDGLDLCVPRGELFAFLGPNGAGKTTTIKMVAGLLKPDSGAIHVWGHPMIGEARQAKAQLAYVPDEPFLYEKLTAREFLEFVGQMYDTGTDHRQRTQELVRQLEITPFLDQLAESFSHGMKQRVVLAAALLHRPRVLIIDEPLVGLDPRTVRTVKDLMRELTDSGGAVFMSTHTLEVAESIADRIGIIHRGRLIAVGSLEELRREARKRSSLEEIFLSLTADEEDASPETIPH